MGRLLGKLTWLVLCRKSYCIITSFNLNINDHFALSCCNVPPVLPSSHQSPWSPGGTLRLCGLSFPRGFGCLCSRSPPPQHSSVTLAQAWGPGLSVRRGCGKNSWGPPPILLRDSMEAQGEKPFLLASVPRLVPCYPDPDLALLLWCPASVGHTCLTMGDLPGSLGCRLALGTTTGPALLFLLELCGSAALVGEGQPSCRPSPRSGCSWTKSISEKLCCPIKGDLMLV